MVYSPGIDLIVTSTPRISTKEKLVTIGGASGSGNTAAESTGLISPGGKQKKYQTMDLAQLTEIYNTKAITLIIGLCSSTIL
jgi:molybdenum cofactor biosynthesis enzyme